MTLLVGLTGSIGMGKTTTAEMFRALGVPVWDADETVHQLYAVGGAAVRPIAELVPAAIVDGAVDRARLKDAIRKQPDLLATIEAIVHPLVAVNRDAFRRNHPTADILVFDIPLLFETHADKWLDAVVVVSAPAALQKQRVLERPGMTQEALDLILSRQIPDAEKRRRADYVIATESMDDTRDAVRQLIAKLKDQSHDA